MQADRKLCQQVHCEVQAGCAFDAKAKQQVPLLLDKKSAIGPLKLDNQSEACFAQRSAGWQFEITPPCAAARWRKRTR